MHSPKSQAGFTMVELMVSMVISLLVGLAALASVQFSLGMQRQTTGVSASVMNVNTAFSAMKYEAGQAGLGFFNKGKFACSTFNVSKGTAASVTNAALLPVSIGGSSTVPALNLFYATALESAASATLTAAATNVPNGTAQIATYLPVTSGQDVLLVPSAPGTTCSLMTVTDVAASTGSGQTLTFASTGLRNQFDFGTITYAKDDSVLLTGRLQSAMFTLDGNNQLVLSRPLEGTSAVLAKNVVALAMQYGISSPGGSSIIGWRYPKGYPSLSSGAEDWTTLTAAALGSQVKAIKIAALVRSEQKDKKVDGACATTESMPSLLGTPLGSSPNAEQGMSGTEKITTALTGDWQCYRYSETSVVIPLRNLLVGPNT